MDLLPKTVSEDFVKTTVDFLQQCSEMVSSSIQLRAQLKKKSIKIEGSKSAKESELSARKSDVCQECGLKFDGVNTKLFIRPFIVRKRFDQIRNKKTSTRLLLGIECLGCGNKYSNMSSALPFKSLRIKAMHERDAEIGHFSNRLSFSSSSAANNTPQVSLVSRQEGSIRSQSSSIRSFTPLLGQPTKPKQRTDRVKKLRMLAERLGKTPEVADRSLSSFLASLAKQ